MNLRRRPWMLEPLEPRWNPVSIPTGLLDRLNAAGLPLGPLTQLIGHSHTSTPQAQAPRVPAPGQVSHQANSARGALVQAVVNQAPTVTLGTVSGLRDGKYDAGSQFTIDGSATDPEDGALGASSLRWTVFYVANPGTPDVDRDGLSGRTHSRQAISGVSTLAFTPPTNSGVNSANVAYFIRLSALDSSGRFAPVKTLRINPNLVTLTLATNVPGLKLARNSNMVSTPSNFVSVVGHQYQLVAPGITNLAPVSYAFDNWSQGGDNIQYINAPATSTTYTANYRAVSTSGPIVVQAESLTLNGYQRVPLTTASGGQFIKATANIGSASGTFNGPDGRYLIHVVPFDETDGQSQVALRINSVQIASWILDEKRGSAVPDAKTRVMTYLGFFDLTQGSTIELRGQRNGSELAAFDNLVFTPVDSKLEFAMNTGGGFVGRFEADADYNIQEKLSLAVPSFLPTNLSQIANPANNNVYLKHRLGRDFTYTLPYFNAATTYLVRLHFSSDTYVAGQANFNVLANNSVVISNLDLFTAAGGAKRAFNREFTVQANSSGAIVLQFVQNSGAAMVWGIEIFSV
ncbi:MAG: malectin domain-containing carbohydrate-binding protein [Gemmataceae bacterium]